MGKHRLFSALFGGSGQYRSVCTLLTRLQVGDPTLSTPVKVRRTLGTGRNDDSSRRSMVAVFLNIPLQLQSRPACFQRWRAPASHPEDLGVARLDLLALRLHL